MLVFGQPISPICQQMAMIKETIMELNKPGTDFYSFTPESAFNEIQRHWTAWDAIVKPSCYVVGISGGIDSSCVAALVCKLYGKDRVVGVSLPCNGQSDMTDVNAVFEHLGIKRITIDIGDMFMYGINAIENNAIELTDVCRTNMPARIRMTMLYGVAQCMNGIVVNTCNRSESILGNDTLFGDDCGSYAPIQALTKTEVKAIAAWLGLPDSLVNKTPIDGLQPLTDEDRLGITYSKVDDYIRTTGEVSQEDRENILTRFSKNRFKLETVHIQGPAFNFYPDAIRANYCI